MREVIALAALLRPAPPSRRWIQPAAAIAKRVGDATVGARPVRLAIDLDGHVTHARPRDGSANDRRSGWSSRPTGAGRRSCARRPGTAARAPSRSGGAMPGRARPGSWSAISSATRTTCGWSYDGRWLALLVWTSAPAVRPSRSAPTAAATSSRARSAGYRSGFAWDPRTSRIAVAVPLRRARAAPGRRASHRASGPARTVIARAMQGRPSGRPTVAGSRPAAPQSRSCTPTDRAGGGSAAAS